MPCSVILLPSKSCSNGVRKIKLLFVRQFIRCPDDHSPDNCIGTRIEHSSIKTSKILDSCLCICQGRIDFYCTSSIRSFCHSTIPRHFVSVAKYRESIVAESGSLVADTYAVESDAAVSQLLIQQNALQNELKRIDKTLTDNKRIRHYVAEMKLMIQLPDGSTMPVTAENIVGLSDTIDYLIAKRKMVSSDLRTIMHRLSKVQKEQDTEEEQLAFFKSESLIEVFDKKIAAVPINAVAIEKEIKRLEKALKAIRREISIKTKSDTGVTKSLYENMVKYATELGVGNSESIANSYLFTSNLKELSGAVLHKTVFAFRLAYIVEIEKHLGIKLPIILDSPSGKEVDQANIQLMVNILKRDFADNQIIIASIFQYDFETVNVIEINNRLIE